MVGADRGSGAQGRPAIDGLLPEQMYIVGATVASIMTCPGKIFHA